MIAWWGWIAIWGGLFVALLAMLGLFAWWLFRKFLVLVDDVAELGESTAVLDAEEYEHVRPAIAVLAEVADIRRRENARRAHRASRQRERHDRRMTRARRITSLEASQRDWPADWYHR